MAANDPVVGAGFAEAPRVAVLGIGQMGLVCASLLASGIGTAGGTGGAGAGKGVSGGKEGVGGVGGVCRAGSVSLWGHSADEAGEVSQTRRSDRLPGLVLPDGVRVCIRAEDALGDADLIVSAIPVQYMRETWLGIRGAVRGSARRGAGVLSVAKGIENVTLLRPTRIIAEVLGDDPDRGARAIGVLSGPTIAAELARCLPATMIAASDEAGFGRFIQRLFSTSWLRVYTNEDVVGVELAGAMKNVIAIAAGIVDGLGAGYNAKSALLARGLAEITRLGVAMGASTDTFFGIAGVGDLATTCFSPEGRNRSLGEALGRGVLLGDYLKESRSVVEGVATTQSVMDLARRYRVDMPLTEGVHAVLFEGTDPIHAIGRLMSRELKEERVG